MTNDIFFKAQNPRNKWLNYKIIKKKNNLTNPNKHTQNAGFRV